ncbi:MAG: phospholipase [Kineosporiaceae bacterium]
MTSPPPDPEDLTRAGQGAVLLDVGEDRGALVVLAPADLERAEIEISGAGRPRTGTHVAVLPRHAGAGGQVRHAAVFPSLAAGGYVLWSDDDRAVLDVTVAAGEVTTVSWPGTP